jgi:hypothetical protein
LLAMSATVLMLLFALDSQTVTDEVFEVPASEWRYVAVTLRQVPVAVNCDFGVLSGTGAVRVAVVNGAGLDDLKQGNREPLGSGVFARQGTFSRVVGVPDEYAVILENSGRGSARVRLRLSLDFSGRGQPLARTLSPQRRLVVIAIGATIFLAIVAYSARRLLAVMRS